MTQINTSYERKDVIPFPFISVGEVFMIEEEDNTTHRLRPVFYKRIPVSELYGIDTIYNAIRLSEQYDKNDQLMVWIDPEEPVHPVVAMECKFTLA